MANRISLGLGRIRQLLTRLGEPHRTYDVIHVAGTNGKGSVSAMIANVLQQAGLKTGLYTSPHLQYRWDGIQIAGKSIAHTEFSRIESRISKESQVLEELMRIKSPSAETTELTSFERLTASAFQAFCNSHVDVAIVEVGLGGTYDATNVVDPILTVITSIGIDHTALLGSDIKDIAQAKGGIIKQDVPVVASSDQEYGQVFGVLGQIQRHVNPDHKIKWTPPNSTEDFRVSNRNTARTALETLRDSGLGNNRKVYECLSDLAIETGLHTTQWRGRFEQVDLSLIGGPPNAVLDGAHNEQSIKALAQILFAGQPKTRTFILAMTKGKDPAHFQTLLRNGDNFLTVEFEEVDGMSWISPASSAELLENLATYSMTGSRGQDFGSEVSRAIKVALNLYPAQELVICGSLYLIGQVYRLLENARCEEIHYPIKTCSQPSKSYDPEIVENNAQRYWNAQTRDLRQQNASPHSIKKFLLPPPNVTGSLHIGHALTVTIQDAYSRYYSAHGDQVFWIPGTDHAGIATQSVVSKQLAKDGVNTKNLTRAEFVAAIYEWKEHYGGIISHQIKRLGASLDWTSEYFTMDSARKSAVTEAFRLLWDAGLIRRENRMVNWSISLQSVISDIEVDQKVIDEPTSLHGAPFGQMWRIRFKLSKPPTSDGIKYVEVDTTRPETIFGDRTLAVHPNDQRYADLIGARVEHPLLDGVFLDIVSDSYVRQDFGTGCVKITPAHDFDDYEVSLRHPSIPVIPVFEREGKMLEIPGYPELQGLDRLTARATVIRYLKQANKLVSVQPHKTTLRLCSRTGALIEPLLMPQWYITMKPLAARVLSLDNIKMQPKVYKEWTRWLTEVRDWCISRQLVWGHRIPLYRVVGSASVSERWVFGTDEADARKNAGGADVEQDKDVLDTWFSSALLPMSAFGWPHMLSEKVHKLEFIESGPDILFFWLARMAMLCTFLSGDTPFKEIVLHPLIRDAQGRKMSKSLGNVLDPMSLIQGQDLASLLSDLEAGNLGNSELVEARAELSRVYPSGIQPGGADALRFALTQSTIQTEALKFDKRSIVAARYLCTKLWNAVNFYNTSLLNIVDDTAAEGQPMPNDHRLFEKWITLRLKDTQVAYDHGFTARELSTSTEALRSFIVNHFCDVYLEWVKASLRENSQTAKSSLRHFRETLETTLQMLAPFMPHITEALWHALGNRCSIHQQSMPVLVTGTSEGSGVAIDRQVGVVLEILKQLQNIIERKSTDVLLHSTENEEDHSIVLAQMPYLQRLSHIKSLHLSRSPPSGRTIQITKDISLSYQPKIDTPATSHELTSAEKRLLKKLEQLRAAVRKPQYALRVPIGVQRKHQSEMKELELKLKAIL